MTEQELLVTDLKCKSKANAQKNKLFKNGQINVKRISAIISKKKTPTLSVAYSYAVVLCPSHLVGGLDCKRTPAMVLYRPAAITPMHC
jgi:hypothetical protein